MFIALKIVNALRLLLNSATVILFIDYFNMQGSPNADELPFYAGLLMLLIPTIILWAADLIIYSVLGSTRNIYFTFLVNAHFALFILTYIAGQFIEFDGYCMMLFMFFLLLVGSTTNLYQLCSFKLLAKQ